MSKDNAITEKKMEKQRKIKQREEQYGIFTSLGWKSTGILFLVIIISIIIYVVFFR